MTSLKKLATELAQIELKLEQMEAKKLIKRSTELKKEILAIATTPDSSGELIVVGEGVEVIFGAVPMVQTIVDNHRLQDLLGNSTFVALAEFSLKDLEDYLTKPQIASVTVELAGTRHFKEARRTT